MDIILLNDIKVEVFCHRSILKTVSVGTDLQWETRVAELEAKVVLLEKQLNETHFPWIQFC